MSGSNTKAGFLLVLVFLAGAAAGIAGDRLNVIPRAAEATEAAEGAPEPDEDRDRDEGTIIERFADELGLSDTQRREVDGLLDRYGESVKELRRQVQPKYWALMDSVRQEIESLLDEDQRAQYRALLEQRYGRAGRGDARSGGSDQRDRRGHESDRSER